MNYGAIGFVIGHEITHGFDDQGRQFDKSGNLVDWWAEETKKRYLEKASCIIRQYGNYTAEEVGLKVRAIDPELTRGTIKLTRKETCVLPFETIRRRSNTLVWGRIYLECISDVRLSVSCGPPYWSSKLSSEKGS